MKMNEPQFKEMGEIDVDYNYEKGFGSMKSKTAYAGVFTESDSYKNLADPKCKGIDTPSILKKHVSSMLDKAMGRMNTKALEPDGGGSTSATGNVLVPISVDREITDLTEVPTPLRLLIRRESNRGLSADFNQLTTLGDPQFLGMNASIPGTSDTYARVNVPMKFVYVRGGVFGQTEAGMSGFFDVAGMDLEIRNKTNALYQLEENTIINGDATSNALEFSGMIKIISDGGQSTNKSGAALELADIRDIVTKVFHVGRGRVSLCVTDGYTWDNIASKLEDQYRNVDRRTGMFGMEMIMFNTYVGKVPIIVDFFMPTTGGAREFLALDMRYWAMRVLLDYTLVPLGITRDATEFFIKAYYALICKAPAKQGRIYAIE